MKRYFILLAAGLTILTVNSCSVVSLALSTASLVGHSALLAHDLTTFVGSHKTAYTFELVSMTNDGGIGNASIVNPLADSESKAGFKDDLIDFTFQYKYNCFVPAFKGQSNQYLTINWNDIVMDGTTKLLWRDGNSSLSTITKAGYNEANLYVVYDSVSGTHRTLPLYVSQAKADEANLAGQTFTLVFPIINVDKVIAYTATIKISNVSVK